VSEPALEDLAFDHDQLVEALDALVGVGALGEVRRASLVATVPPPAERHRLGQFLARHAAARKLEITEVSIVASEIARILGRVGHALIALPGSPVRWLVVRGRGRRGLTVIDRAAREHRLDVAEVAGHLIGDLTARAAAEVDATLVAAGLRGRPARRARRSLLDSRLADAEVAGIWMVRPPPGRSFAGQLAKTGVWRRAALLLALQLTSSATVLVAWWAIARVFLEGAAEGGWLTLWVIALAAALPMRFAVGWVQSELALVFGVFLRRRLLSGALALDPDRIKQDGLGRLLGLVFECDEMERMLTWGAARVVLAAISLVPVPLVMLAGASGWLHVALLAVWLVGIIVAARHLYERRRAWTRARLEITDLTIDSLVGQRTRLLQLPPGRWHDGEDVAVARYLGASAAFDRARVWNRHLSSGGWLATAIGLMMPAVLAGETSARLAITVGAVLLAYAAIDQLADGMADVIGALDAWRRVAPIYSAAAAAPRPGTIAAGFEVTGARNTVLEARQVSFTYPGQSHKVLDQINLRLGEGDRVLLLGSSGAGKSTLASLLAGQRHAQEGSITLDELDASAIGDSQWRRRVALVPQFHENHLVSGTFLFNLMLGCPWPPRHDDFRAAFDVCTALGLDPLLATMPAGPQQLVGDMGWNLSHGERSRLYIARALLQEPDILILDESLTALDPELLQRVGAAVLARARTLVVIAHP
jgi:ATP-binding cassette subfamily B protein